MINSDQLHTQFEHCWSCVEAERLSVPDSVEPSCAAAPGMFACGKIGTVVAAELLEVSVGGGGSRLVLYATQVPTADCRAAK
jgi:hypothetical protein